MKRRHIIILASVILCAVTIILMCRGLSGVIRTPSVGSEGPQGGGATLKGGVNAVAIPGGSPEMLSKGSPLAEKLNAPDVDAMHDVQAVHGMIRQYLRMLHSRQGLPIGDDIDLARVLTGRNPMKRVFIPAGNPALSPDGHLRDRWGTPYFIHPVGYGTFEVRSAGPDRKMFTGDDVVDGTGEGMRTEIPDGLGN